MSGEMTLRSPESVRVLREKLVKNLADEMGCAFRRGMCSYFFSSQHEIGEAAEALNRFLAEHYVSARATLDFSGRTFFVVFKRIS